MARIAVIDDAIHDMVLSKRVSERYCLENGEFYKTGRCEETGLSHGTLVANVLEQYSAAYELISIQMIGNWFTEKRCQVAALCQALDLCTEIGCDVINISVGTKRLSASRALGRALGKVLHAGIPIVAACSNTFYRTVPAAQPGVFGVTCDPMQRLAPGSYAFSPEPYLGTDYIANYELTLPGIEDAHRSNSLAAAVLTAQVNNLIHHAHLSHADLAEALRAESMPYKFCPAAYADRTTECPVVYLSDLLTGRWEEQIALINLFADAGYEVLAGSDRSLDARFLSLPALGCGTAKELQQRLCACAKVDLILVFTSPHWLKLQDWRDFDAESAIIVSAASTYGAVQPIPIRHRYRVSQASGAKFLYGYLRNIL